MKDTISKKFDVIVGNPPFQDGSVEKKGNSGKKNLYQKFIELYCSLVKQDGIIAFISPRGFLKTTDYRKSNKYFEMLNRMNPLMINLTGVADHFSSVWNPQIAYFIYQNIENRGSTIIISDDRLIVDTRRLKMIPSSLDKNTISILDKVFNKEGQKLNIYRDDNKPNQSSVSLKRLNNRYTTLKAETGPDNGTLRVLTDHPSEMVSFLNSRIMSYINRRNWFDGIIYHKYFQGVTIPDNMGKNYSDQELFEFYNLSEEEINEVVENSKSLLKRDNEN